MSRTEWKCIAVFAASMAVSAAVVIAPLAYVLHDGPATTLSTAGAGRPVMVDKPAERAENLPEHTTTMETKTQNLDAELIGRTIWGEAGGVADPAERAAVAWCILNRVDAWGGTIQETVTAPKQFQGYRPWGECPQEHIDLAADVLARWADEKAGVEDVGRVLPAEYLYFLGDGEHNHFSVEFLEPLFWDWSLDSPYNETK